jgi:hypothetical protein
MEIDMARQEKAKTEVVFPGTDTALPLEALKATVAMELAAGLSDSAGVRERYGISAAQWQMLRVNPTFRKMLREAIERLSGDTNAGSRIKLKADVMLEDNLAVLDEIANDRDAQSQARIEAVKTMAQFAGRSQKDSAPAGAAGGFALNIIIGDGHQGVTVEGTPVRPALEQAE